MPLAWWGSFVRHNKSSRSTSVQGRSRPGRAGSKSGHVRCTAEGGSKFTALTEQCHYLCVLDGKLGSFCKKRAVPLILELNLGSSASLFCRLPQPNAGSAAILLDELDARRLKFSEPALRQLQPHS